jgi:hypothetical protein
MLAKPPNDSASVLADAIRSACIKAALLAYDDAGIRRLCHEGVGSVRLPRYVISICVG